VGKEDVERAVAEMTAITSEYLETLSPEEREERLRAFEQAGASLPASPPSRAAHAKSSEDSEIWDSRVQGRGKR
jgi:hypothetical protein